MRWKISPVVQIDFPESEIIRFINFDGENRKKEDLLRFKNKIIDVEIYKDFSCLPSLDTTLSIKFRARIIGECEREENFCSPFASSPIPEYENWSQPPWNIGAICKDNVVAEPRPDGTLAIKGKGKMMNFFYTGFEDNKPWLKICNKGNVKVVIESGVTHIGSQAFRNCDSLTSIIIPDSVTSIGDMAFSYCINLISITILNPTPLSIYWREFYGVNKDTCTLYVPKGSVDAYRKAKGWAYFKNIKPIE